MKGEQDNQRREEALANAVGLRSLSAIVAAVPVRLTKRDLIFIVDRLLPQLEERCIEVLARNAEAGKNPQWLRRQCRVMLDVEGFQTWSAGRSRSFSYVIPPFDVLSHRVRLGLAHPSGLKAARFGRSSTPSLVTKMRNRSTQQ